ncbi:MAG: lipoate--protein ligase family protein [Actinobacteria bacterium]|nr:lipoate--protein ligase family protein [Actinomycetota bacterium]
MSSWRLIVDGPQDGARNMAVDRALLDEHAAGVLPPTLRIYGWSRPTVSLGRFQDVGDVDCGACRRFGVDICRRPTGGRGVLHDDEITYSIIGGVRDGLPRGVGASYRFLCGALVAAYRELGIEAELTARPRGRRGAGACYLHATGADLSFGAAKLSGSAQVWSRDSCLQHGSLVISRDADLEARVFRLGEAGSAGLRRATRAIADVLGYRPDGDTIVSALVGGVQQGLGVTLEEEPLSDEEAAAAAAGRLEESFLVALETATQGQSTPGR